MRSDDIAVVGVLMAVFGSTLALVGPFLKRRAARQKQRLDILEESLKHPNLDAQTRDEILRVLTREHEAPGLSFLGKSAFWQKLVFGGGWLAFVFCGGMGRLVLERRRVALHRQ